MVSRSHSLLVNLKCKSRSFNHGKRTKRGSNCQLVNSTKISKTKETQWGMQPGSLTSPMADKMFIGDSHLWGGCHSNQSLSHVLSLQTFNNNNFQGVHYTTQNKTFIYALNHIKIKSK